MGRPSLRKSATAWVVLCLAIVCLGSECGAAETSTQHRKGPRGQVNQANLLEEKSRWERLGQYGEAAAITISEKWRPAWTPSFEEAREGCRTAGFSRGRYGNHLLTVEEAFVFGPLFNSGFTCANAHGRLWLSERDASGNPQWACFNENKEMEIHSAERKMDGARGVCIRPHTGCEAVPGVMSQPVVSAIVKEMMSHGSKVAKAAPGLSRVIAKEGCDPEVILRLASFFLESNTRFQTDYGHDLQWLCWLHLKKYPYTSSAITPPASYWEKYPVGKVADSYWLATEFKKLEDPTKPVTLSNALLLELVRLGYLKPADETICLGPLGEIQIKIRGCRHQTIPLKDFAERVSENIYQFQGENKPRATLERLNCFREGYDEVTLSQVLGSMGDDPASVMARTLREWEEEGYMTFNPLLWPVHHAMQAAGAILEQIDGKTVDGRPLSLSDRVGLHLWMNLNASLAALDVLCLADLAATGLTKVAGVQRRALDVLKERGTTLAKELEAGVPPERLGAFKAEVEALTKSARALGRHATDTILPEALFSKKVPSLADVLQSTERAHNAARAEALFDAAVAKNLDPLGQVDLLHDAIEARYLFAKDVADGMGAQIPRSWEFKDALWRAHRLPSPVKGAPYSQTAPLLRSKLAAMRAHLEPEVLDEFLRKGVLGPMKSMPPSSAASLPAISETPLLDAALDTVPAPKMATAWKRSPVTLSTPKGPKRFDFYHNGLAFTQKELLATTTILTELPGDMRAFSLHGSPGGIVGVDEPTGKTIQIDASSLLDVKLDGEEVPIGAVTLSCYGALDGTKGRSQIAVLAKEGLPTVGFAGLVRLRKIDGKKTMKVVYEPSAAQSKFDPVFHTPGIQEFERALGEGICFIAYPGGRVVAARTRIVLDLNESRLRHVPVPASE